MVPRGYNACISGTGSCAVKDERTGRLLLGARAQRVPTREEPARCPHNKGSPTLSVKADGFGRADSKCAWICTWFSQRLPEVGSKVRILRFRTEEGPEARPGPGPSASVKDTAEVGTGPGLTRLVQGAWGWGTPPGDLYKSSPATPADVAGTACPPPQRTPALGVRHGQTDSRPRACGCRRRPSVRLVLAPTGKEK